MAPGITTGIRSKRRFKLYFSRLLPRLYYVWETEMFNEFFYFYGRRYSRFLTIWFSLGIGVSLLVSLAVILILIWHWSWLIFPGNQNNALVMNPGESRNSITLVVPGLNVPWSDIGYILFGTIIAVGFHEVGHALAAASEGVRIEHVAVFLACLFPGALVGLNHSSLQLLPPIRALRIYCAGIWHNVVVFYLDGEAILRSWLSMITHSVHPRKQRQLLRICLIIGSTLLFFGIISGIIKQFS
eukprot:c24146_g1_i1 orf=242-967(+)